MQMSVVAVGRHGRRVLLPLHATVMAVMAVVVTVVMRGAVGAVGR